MYHVFFIGLKNAGIIQAHPVTLVTIGNLNLEVAFAVLGLISMLLFSGCAQVIDDKAYVWVSYEPKQCGNNPSYGACTQKDRKILGVKCKVDVAHVLTA